jgi:hypothetical protein
VNRYQAHTNISMDLMAKTQLIWRVGWGDGQHLGAEEMDATLAYLLGLMDRSGKARSDELFVAAT